MDDRLTIVGPEPSTGREGPRTGRVHIEALLLMAKYDNVFRRLLLEDRERAIAECGIEFTPSERLIILNTSANNLETGIREYAPSGITRESLSSWREAAAVILLLLSLVAGDVACADSPVRGAGPGNSCRDTLTVADIASFQDGFCGNDIFRLRADGVPSKTSKNAEERKDSSLKFATINAQYMLVEKFIGACIQGGGVMHGEMTDDGAPLWRARLKELVKKGEVIAVAWDEEQNCSIVYEVRKDGLKKWALSCY